MADAPHGLRPPPHLKLQLRDRQARAWAAHEAHANNVQPPMNDLTNYFSLYTVTLWHTKQRLDPPQNDTVEGRLLNVSLVERTPKQDGNNV